MQPGRSFDVPRTALLLTGSVKSQLPLPRAFSMAVSNPARTASAADLLWPDNILGKDHQPASSSQRSSINGNAHTHLQDSASSAANAAPAGSVLGGSDGAAADGESVLTAPTELPPGEFDCLIEAMVLQVRGGRGSWGVAWPLLVSVSTAARVCAAATPSSQPVASVAH
jgi:hypothetical protein